MLTKKTPKYFDTENIKKKYAVIKIVKNPN
jgi:hypothetical protein